MTSCDWAALADGLLRGALAGACLGSYFLVRRKVRQVREAVDEYRSLTELSNRSMRATKREFERTLRELAKLSGHDLEPKEPMQ